MELIYCAMLLHRAHKPITETNVKSVLHAVGISKSDGEIKGLVAALDGVDIEKAIKEAVMPMASPVAATAHVEKKAAKEEEPKEDPEKAAAGLSALFG